MLESFEIPKLSANLGRLAKEVGSHLGSHLNIRQSFELFAIDQAQLSKVKVEMRPLVFFPLTEWWRLSTVCLSFGLMVCGLGFPFAQGSKMGLLLGASVLSGSILSAGILYWQVRRQEASSNPVVWRIAVQALTPPDMRVRIQRFRFH